MSKEVSEYIQFEIPNYEDRQNLIRALANAGYKVWVVNTQYLSDNKYFVNVEKP